MVSQKKYHIPPLRVDYQIFLTCLLHEILPMLASHTDSFLDRVLPHNQDRQHRASPTVFVLTLSHEYAPAQLDTPNLALHDQGQNFPPQHR